MHIFTNILVGIDLARINPLDVAALTPVVQEPNHWGIQLAKANAARLMFFSASNIGEEALLPLDEEDREQVRKSVFQGSSKVFHVLMEQAQLQGVASQSKLVPGKGWLEIIHQVLRDKHDLVVIGTRDQSNLHHMFFGNTSVKLVRRCPCPVLVARPPKCTGDPPLNILVATNLKPPSEDALRLGIALANQMNARLHVLHVVEYELDDICNIGLPDAKQDEYRRKVRSHAQEILHAQMEKTEYKTLGSRIKVHLAGDVGFPDVAIKHFIEAHRIHLMVMGTIGRGGLRGIMIGNTAERLLSEVRCSVLAVKPPDFVCPIEE